MAERADFIAANTYYNNAKEYAACYISAMRQRRWLDAEGQMRKVCESIYFCMCAEKGETAVQEPEFMAGGPGERRPRFGKTQLQHLAALIQKDGSGKTGDLARAVRLLETVANPAAHAEARPVPAELKAKNLLIGGRRTMRLLIHWFFQESDVAQRFEPWNPWTHTWRRWLVWGGAAVGLLALGLVWLVVVSGQQVRELLVSPDSGVAETKELRAPSVVQVGPLNPSDGEVEVGGRREDGAAAVRKAEVVGREPSESGSASGASPVSVAGTSEEGHQASTTQSPSERAAFGQAEAAGERPPTGKLNSTGADGEGDRSSAPGITPQTGDGLSDLSPEQQDDVYAALETVEKWYESLGVNRESYYGLMDFPLHCYYSESRVPKERVAASRDKWFDGRRSGRPADFGWPVQLAWVRDDEVALVLAKPGTEAVLNPSDGGSRKGLLVRRVEGRWLIAGEVSLGQNGRRSRSDASPSSPVPGPCLPGIFESAQGRAPLPRRSGLAP